MTVGLHGDGVDVLAALLAHGPDRLVGSGLVTRNEWDALVRLLSDLLAVDDPAGEDRAI